MTERLLYRDKVDAIIGFWRSELAIASQPLVMEAKKNPVFNGCLRPYSDRRAHNQRLRYL